MADAVAGPVGVLVRDGSAEADVARLATSVVRDVRSVDVGDGPGVDTFVGASVARALVGVGTPELTTPVFAAFVDAVPCVEGRDVPLHAANPIAAPTSMDRRIGPSVGQRALDRAALIACRPCGHDKDIWTPFRQAVDDRRTSRNHRASLSSCGWR